MYTQPKLCSACCHSHVDTKFYLECKRGQVCVPKHTCLKCTHPCEVFIRLDGFTEETIYSIASSLKRYKEISSNRATDLTAYMMTEIIEILRLPCNMNWESIKKREETFEYASERIVHMINASRSKPDMYRCEVLAMYLAVMTAGIYSDAECVILINKGIKKLNEEHN